ncbi:MAG: DNA polymerase IV [Erysipelotrichaceae bacterium]
MNKYIFHIDLNAFFVSAQELLNPEIKGKAVAIAGLKARSVVTSASYEAREYGVTSGESVLTAKKKCPHLLIIPANIDFYVDLSHQFIDFIKSYSDEVEVASIDECYVNMTQTIKKYPYPLDLAVELQKECLKQLSLKCSIGIAENKFLAKMASDMKKPMGITVIRKEEIQSKLWPLEIGSMYGVGKKSREQLIKLGICTIKDLATYQDVKKLNQVFGIHYQEMIDRANGMDHSVLEQESTPKSLSQSQTFNEDVNDFEMIQTSLLQLSKRLEKRLNKYHLAGKSITLSIRYDDFKTISRSTPLNFYTHSSTEIYEIATRLYEQYDVQNAKRLLRIGINHLIDQDKISEEIALFEV